MEQYRGDVECGGVSMDERSIAQEALDSAKSAHHRIDALEHEVGDLRTLTVAVGKMGERLEGVKADVEEIKTDVKAITDKPGKLQDKLIAAALTALATGLVGAVLALILK